MRGKGCLMSGAAARTGNYKRKENTGNIKTRNVVAVIKTAT